MGYACPHYVQRGIVTEGSEIYSFGIVLLELLTASPPAYVDGTLRLLNPHTFVRMRWSYGFRSGCSRLSAGVFTGTPLLACRIHRQLDHMVVLGRLMVRSVASTWLSDMCSQPIH